MLSIRFDSKTEWWVSSETLARPVEAALRDGVIPAHLEEWRPIADANGGLDLSQLAPADAGEFVAAARSPAEREVQRLTAATVLASSPRLAASRIVSGKIGSVVNAVRSMSHQQRLVKPCGAK